MMKCSLATAKGALTIIDRWDANGIPQACLNCFVKTTNYCDVSHTKFRMMKSANDDVPKSREGEGQTEVETEQGDHLLDEDQHSAMDSQVSNKASPAIHATKRKLIFEEDPNLCQTKSPQWQTTEDPHHAVSPFHTPAAKPPSPRRSLALHKPQKRNFEPRPRPTNGSATDKRQSLTLRTDSRSLWSTPKVRIAVCHQSPRRFLLSKWRWTNSLPSPQKHRTAVSLRRMSHLPVPSRLSNKLASRTIPGHDLSAHSRRLVRI